jgi:hypothetical protein
VILTALSLLVAAQVRLDGQAAVRLETRGRTATLADSPGYGLAGDAEVTPSLKGTLRGGGSYFLLAYAPTARVREPYAATRRWELNHSQSLYAQWYREGRPRPYLNESFYFGQLDIATLYGRAEPVGPDVPPPGAQPVQTALLGSMVREMTLDTTAGVAWPIGKNVTLDTSGSFIWGGGVDAPSRNVLPEQYSGKGSAKLESRLSDVNAVLAQLDGQHVVFLQAADSQPMSRFTLSDFAMRWRRRFLPELALIVGGGGAVVSGWTERSQSPRVTGVPIGDISLEMDGASRAHAVMLRATVGVTPFVDRFLATVYPRAEAAANFTYLYRGHWQVKGRGGVARSIAAVTAPDRGPVNELTSLFVDGRLGYLEHFWRVEAYGTDSLVFIGGSTINNWVAGLSVTVEVGTL